MSVQSTKEDIDHLLLIWKECEEGLQSSSAYEHVMQQDSTVNFREVNNLACKMALTEHAPNGWREELPLINALPPAPQPEQMRIGVLAEYNRQQQSRQLPIKLSNKHDIRRNNISYEEDYTDQVRERLQRWQHLDDIWSNKLSNSMDAKDSVPPSSSMKDVDLKGELQDHGQQRRANVSFEAWADDSDEDNS